MSASEETAPSPSSKVVAVAKPDEAHYEALVKEETNAIEVIRSRMAVLDEKSAEHMAGRDEFVRQRGEQRAKINEITAKVNALMEERTRLQSMSTRAAEHGRNLRSQIDQLQRTLGFSSVEEIDKRISEIQYEMMVSTLSLNEEKKMISDMDKLRKLKPEFRKLADLEERAELAEGTVGGVSSPSTGGQGMRARLDEIRDELNALRDLRTDENDKLQALQEERAKQEEPLRDIRDERDDLRRKLGTHQARINQLQSERRAKDTEWRAYQAKLRAARTEIERWERQRNQVDADKKLVHDELASLSEGTYDWRSLLAIQVIAYMKEQMEEYETAKKKAQETPAAEEEEPEEIENIENCRVYQRKKVEVMAVGNKKSKKTKRQGQKREPKVVSDRLQHTMETIRDFSSLGFDTDYPLTIADCPKAIAKLEKIVEAQKAKNLAHAEVIKNKRAKLEARLVGLQAREAELMTAMPAK